MLLCFILHNVWLRQNQWFQLSLSLSQISLVDKGIQWKLKFWKKHLFLGSVTNMQRFAERSCSVWFCFWKCAIIIHNVKLIIYFRINWTYPSVYYGALILAYKMEFRNVYIHFPLWKLHSSCPIEFTAFTAEEFAQL